MIAARLLHPTATLAAAITCSTIHRVSRNNHSLYLDSPTAERWPQDVRLISDARRTTRNKAIDHASSSKKGDAETVDQVNPPDSYTPAFEDDDVNAWAGFSRNF